MYDHTYELSPPAPPNPPPLWPPPPSNAEGEWSGIVLAGISFASSCCLVLLCGLLLIARRRLQIRAAATRTAASDHGELRKMERLLDAMPQQSMAADGRYLPSLQGSNWGVGGRGDGSGCSAGSSGG
mmetsp:Transcript_14238/g.43156  ORF Transcript_14238/g.43156 Transcript_14238/m.43156 type:complete len:127 (-) Transcript_14238:73-453(-)